MNDYYQILAQKPERADLRIDGVIGENVLTESTTARKFVNDLSKIQASHIRVHLNSPGGSVMDANVIYSALRRHPAQVDVIIDGWALSAASIIAMAGDQIYMGPRSLMMLHNPHVTITGDAISLRNTAEVLDHIKDGMIDVYRQRLKQTPEAVAHILEKETWFTSDEALSVGLADQIIPDLKASTSMSILNMPFEIPPSIAAQLSLEDSLLNEELEKKVLELTEALATVTQRLSDEIDARKASEAALQAYRSEVRMQAVKALFHNLGREWTEEDAQPYLGLSDAHFAKLADDLLRIKNTVDPALFQAVAVAGASPPDVEQLNAKLMAQVAGKKDRT